MNEKEPIYITKLREHIDAKFKEVDNKFETHVPKYFIEFKKHIADKFREVDEKFEEVISTTAIGFSDMQKQIDSLENRFDGLEGRFDGLEKRLEVIEYEFIEIKQNMVTKEDFKKVLNYIAIYEIRAQNTENILLQDHKPRIAELEKVVFAI